MKTGIITFHFTHNQGAVLQCYALQTVLNKMGNQAGVINYCPPYHTVRYSAVKNPFVFAISNDKKLKNKKFSFRTYQFVRNFAKSVYLTITGEYKKREENFQQFIGKHLVLSKRYKSLKELQKTPPKFDAYITGSDQVWNPDMHNGSFDKAYFLDFGESSIKKLSYAASLRQTYSEDEKKELASLCRNIDAVSSRETNGALDEVLGRPYEICIDPTLLLQAEDYSSLEAENSEKEPYIFVYGFETSSGIVQAVSEISKALNIRVVNGSPDKIKLPNCKNAQYYGPDKFLSYIKNADFVITNSFHGTAFSLIYNKHFVTVPHTTRGRRMIELLKKLDLSNRLWGDSNSVWEQEIDYLAVNEKLSVLKKESVEFLERNLNM